MNLSLRTPTRAELRAAWDSPVAKVLAQLAISALIYSLRTQKHPAAKVLHRALTVLAAAIAAPSLKSGFAGELKRFRRDLRKLMKDRPEFHDVLSPIITLLGNVKTT